MSVRSRVYRERRLPAERPLAAIIAGLWRNGEQGVWYDPSDLSTMYQDAAGTLPVYAPGQGQVDPPVGLWLDKRLGFALGPERITNTGFRTLSGWTAVRGSTATVSGGAVTVTTANPQDWGSVSTPIATEPGKSYLVKVLMTSGNGQNVQLLISESAVNHVNITNTGGYRNATGYYSLVFKATKAVHYVWLGSATNTASVGISTWTMPSVREISANYAYQTTTTSRPTLSARYNLLTGTESLATQSVTVVATTYVLKTAGPGSVTLSGAASGTYTAGSRMVTCTAGALTLTVLGSVTQADLRPANDGVGLPPYQRVIDANTYDTVFFPPYLKFDGVDDFLQTAAVDFSGTDKITLACSTRKQADTSVGELLGFSATPNLSAGGFGVLAPPSATPRLEVSVCGTTNGYVHVHSAAPETGVYVARLNLAVAGVADGKVSVRKNGTAVSPLQSGSGAGTGNFGNYPLYIGRRGGSSLPFNGRLYSLLIRGAATSDDTITKVERYLNQKAKVF